MTGLKDALVLVPMVVTVNMKNVYLDNRSTTRGTEEQSISDYTATLTASPPCLSALSTLLSALWNVAEAAEMIEGKLLNARQMAALNHEWRKATQLLKIRLDELRAAKEAAEKEMKP